ncbi:MAG: hypothetical protein LBP56_06330 [Odoribacteraceae bacterium]|nr:hypothetical protein [Odoribacteraceae bacterium]
MRRKRGNGETDAGAKDFSPLHLNVIVNPEGEAIQGWSVFWIASRSADRKDGHSQ